MESDEFYETCFDLSRMEASGRGCNATRTLLLSLLSQLLPFLLPLLPPHPTLGEIRLEQRAWWSLCFPALFCLDRPVFLQIRPVKGNDGGRVSALMGATLLD